MEKTLKPGQNTGVLPIAPTIKPTDFYAGGETGVVKIVLEKSGQYDIFLPDEETQYVEGFDAFNCVSESADNALEVVFNFKLANGLFSAPAVKFLKDNGYIDPMTNKVNFSDRFTAKGSGTTQRGNSLGAVGDWIRGKREPNGAVLAGGLVPEKVWPWPKEIVAGMSRDEAWAIYYKDVPAAAIELGKKFLGFFKPAYEWTVLDGLTPDHKAAILAALQHGPVQIVSAVCAPWNSNEANPPIPACGCGTQHATLCYGLEGMDKPIKDFDTYKSYRKLLAPDYCIPYAMQYFVEEIPQNVAPIAPFKYTYAINLRYGNAGNEVIMLQKGLQAAGFMKAGVFGPYGPATRTAVAVLQNANGIKDPDGQGMNFGPQSRSALNAIINK